MQSSLLWLKTRTTDLTHPYTPCTDSQCTDIFSLSHDCLTAGVNITLCKAVYDDHLVTTTSQLRQPSYDDHPATSYDNHPVMTT